MGEIQYPYQKLNVVDTTPLSKDLFNKIDDQVEGLTDRIGGSWTDLTRPTDPKVLATHPAGWNSTRNDYEFWNGSTWVQLSGGGGLTSVVVTTVTTPPSIQVKDWVGIDPGGGVQLASADDIDTEPIGVVGTKLSSTSALVIVIGEIGGYVGLTTGARVFLSSTPGGIVYDPDFSAFPLGLQMIQRIGTVKDSTTITVRLRKAIQIE